MTTDLTIALVAGGFALVGGLSGAVLNARFGYSAESRKIKSEDERRWLADRKNVYARYLGVCSSMHQEIDQVGIFLRGNNESPPIDEDDEAFIVEGLDEYQQSWEGKVQPLLGEVALIASPTVVDLADRVSGALLALTDQIHKPRGTFVEYYPMWFQTQDLIYVLRDEMRRELGLSPVEEVFPVGLRTDANWPWLESRPARSTYVQDHRSHPESR